MRVVRGWSGPRQPLSRSRTPWPLHARVDGTGGRVDATDAGVMRTHAPVTAAGATAVSSGGPLVLMQPSAGFAGVQVIASGRPISTAHVPAIATRGCGVCTEARVIGAGAWLMGTGAAVMPAGAAPVGWGERSDTHHARSMGIAFGSTHPTGAMQGGFLTAFRARAEPKSRRVETRPTTAVDPGAQTRSTVGGGAQRYPSLEIDGYRLRPNPS